MHLCVYIGIYIHISIPAEVGLKVPLLYADDRSPAAAGVRAPRAPSPCGSASQAPVQHLVLHFWRLVPRLADAQPFGILKSQCPMKITTRITSARTFQNVCLQLLLVSLCLLLKLLDLRRLWWSGGDVGWLDSC